MRNRPKISGLALPLLGAVAAATLTLPSAVTVSGGLAGHMWDDTIVAGHSWSGAVVAGDEWIGVAPDDTPWGP
jgi:hypothetical protein